MSSYIHSVLKKIVSLVILFEIGLFLYYTFLLIYISLFSDVQYLNITIEMNDITIEVGILVGLTVIGLVSGLAIGTFNGLQWSSIALLIANCLFLAISILIESLLFIIFYCLVCTLLSLLMYVKMKKSYFTSDV